MSNPETELQNLLAEAHAAKKARMWAADLGDESLTPEQALQKVADVFATQMREPIKSNHQGASFFFGLAALKKAFQSFTPTEEEICSVIERSRSDYYTFQALRVFARISRSIGSPALKRWESELFLGLCVEPPTPRGKSPYSNTHRNMLIISQLRQLEAVGFKPTRGDGKTIKVSGSDIVAQALDDNVTYAAIEAVWKDREDIGLSTEFTGFIDEFLEKLEVSEDKAG